MGTGVGPSRFKGLARQRQRGRLARIPGDALVARTGTRGGRGRELVVLGAVAEDARSHLVFEGEAAIQALHPNRVAQSSPFIDSTLSKSMRECLRPHARRILPDDTRYTLVFDKLEILLVLACVDADSGTTRLLHSAFWYFQENGGHILSDIEESLSSKRDESPYVRSHIFGSTADECHQRLKQVREVIPSRA